MAERHFIYAMPLTKLIEYLRLPLRVAPLLLIAVICLLLAIAQRAALFGLPLFLLAVSWFFKYSFVLLDYMIEGRREPPVLSAEMVNPVEQRPLGLLLLMIGGYVAIGWLEPNVGTTGVLVVRSIALAIVPAMVAAMSVTGRFVHALNPVAVFGMIARIPLAYLSLLLIIGSLWLVTLLLLRWLGVALVGPIGAAVAMYLWLAMMACIGGMTYEHRGELDFEPAESPERTAAKQATELERERDKLLEPIFAQCRGAAFANAGVSVRKLIDNSPQPLTEFRWLYARTAQWPDQRLANYLVQLCLPRLLAAHANGEALDVVRARLRIDQNFRPDTGAQLLRMATLAREAGDKPTARLLLADFERHYPNDVGIAMVAKLAAELHR